MMYHAFSLTPMLWTWPHLPTPPPSTLSFSVWNAVQNPLIEADFSDSSALLQLVLVIHNTDMPEDWHFTAFEYPIVFLGLGEWSSHTYCTTSSSSSSSSSSSCVLVPKGLFCLHRPTITRRADISQTSILPLGYWSEPESTTPNSTIAIVSKVMIVHLRTDHITIWLM